MVAVIARAASRLCRSHESIKKSRQVFGYFTGIGVDNSDPKFEARPNDHLGQNWCVHVTWPSGATDLVTGFENQYSAIEWIRRDSANWTVDKIMNRPD